MGNDVITDNSSLPYNEKIFIIKYSSNGNYNWSGFINDNDESGNGSDEVVSLATDNSNNIFLYSAVHSGSYFGNSQFTTLHNDYAVNTLSKINNSGNFVFTRELSTYSYNNKEGGYGKPHLLTSDNAGNAYAIVNLQAGYSAIPPFLNGAISININGIPSLFLLKYNNNGVLLWYKLIGSNVTQDNYGTQISYINNKLFYTGYLRSAYSDDNYFLFPPLTVPDLKYSYSNLLKYFVAKSDTAANFEWTTTFAGESNVHGLSVASFDNNIYASGSFRRKILDLGSLGDNFENPDLNIYNQFFGKLKDQYIRVGVITPTTLCPGSNIAIPFTSYGLTFSNTNTFTAELSDVNGDFTSPKIIGITTSAGTGSITATIPSNLPYGDGYVVRIKSSDTLKTGYNYFAYADTGYKLTLLCPAPSSGFKTINITAGSATLQWNTVDCAVGYRVQYRKKGTSVWTTVLVNTNTGSLNLTALTANTTYQWRVATKCKPSSIVYSAYSANKQFTTTAAFTANAAVKKNIFLLQATPAITLYPNPANNKVTVEFIARNTENYTLELTDISGKTIQTKTGNAGRGTNTITLNVTRYAQGIYMIKLKIGTEKITLKFNKK